MGASLLSPHTEIVTFTYTLFDSDGNEFPITATAMVLFGSKAATERGFPVESDSSDSVERWNMRWESKNANERWEIPNAASVLPLSMIVAMEKEAIEIAHNQAYENKFL